MSLLTTKSFSKVEIPPEFTKDVIATINRLEQSSTVNGVMYFKKDTVILYTVPQNVEVVLQKKLPQMTRALHWAIKELNKMKIITNLLKDAQDEKLVKTTATLNNTNPIVDRIMDDDSVEGVIMTNKEGAPILTNVSVTHATLYARTLHKYGIMSQMLIKELDPYDEVMALRINTRKNELILTPDRDFLIIVIQLARKIKVKDIGKKPVI